MNTFSIDSEKIVMEYINENERKYVAVECSDYDNMDKWVDYVKSHIYYHFLVVIKGTEFADQEIINIWNEYHLDVCADDAYN